MTKTICRWVPIGSNSRMACVNHVTTVRPTSVITNATMVVVRDMYQPIEPLGLNFPADGPHGRLGSPKAGVAPSEPNSPNG